MESLAGQRRYLIVASDSRYPFVLWYGIQDTPTTSFTMIRFQNHHQTNHGTEQPINIYIYIYLQIKIWSKPEGCHSELAMVMCSKVDVCRRPSNFHPSGDPKQRI